MRGEAMSPAAALVSTFVAALALRAPEEILRRGYELLPDARWREELERDRASEFLGMALPSPPRSSFNNHPPGFLGARLRSKRALSDVVPRADLSLGLRANLNRWGDSDTYFRGHVPSTPFQPPLDPLLLPK